MFKVEKRWGNFEFEIIGTNEIVDSKNIERTFVRARLDLDGKFAQMNYVCDDFIPVENYETMVNELEKCIRNNEYCQFNLNEVRFYVIPSQYEIDINTASGVTELYESEFGEDYCALTIAVKLYRDESYDEIYPNNKFIPNVQINLEQEETLRFVSYLKRATNNIANKILVS